MHLQYMQNQVNENIILCGKYPFYFGYRFFVDTQSNTHSVSCHSQFFPKGIDVHFDNSNEKRQKNVTIPYIY